MPIRVIGDTAYRATLAGMGAKVGAKATAATLKTGAMIERDAKILAPVDTGTLRNSVSTSVTGGAMGVTVEIGPTVDYAEHVERGTSRMAAQPYLNPATDRHIAGWYDALSKAMDT